jgi:hypothetical protein
MPQVRKFKMTKTKIKGIAAVLCVVPAIALSLRGPSSTKTGKNSQPASGNELRITNPESKDDYGIGTYRVEGVLSKNTKVKISLDEEEVKTVTTNSADGQYDLDVDVKEAGKHTLFAQFKDSKGKLVTKQVPFSASKSKMAASSDSNTDSNTEETPVKVGASGDSKPSPDEDAATSSTLLPDDSVAGDDPNSEANRKASGANDAVIKAKPKSEAKKPPVKPEPKAKPSTKDQFVLSSHTNFNVVPHGIIKVGGKGNPGDKIMLLVDNKPSMRGTVKPDGKWTFPVKISKPGFRRITAQDLKSRESKSVKLKIK